MAKNLKPVDVYNFLTNDFTDGWDSVAWNPSARGRGNFMFAILAMGFLEFTCRLCKSDNTGAALGEFSRRLSIIDRRYFKKIPGLKAGTGSEFVLPFTGSDQTNDLLICALFDLIRNGLAHQYQQILVKLRGGKYWGITLTGPSLGRHLGNINAADRKKSTHLTLKRDARGDVWMVVNPARLFLDFKKAFDESALLERKLKIAQLTRPDAAHGKDYDFGTIALETALAGTGTGGFRK